MLLPFAELPGSEVPDLQQFRDGLGEPIQHIRVLGAFLRGMQGLVSPGYFEESGEDVGDFLVGDFELPGRFGHEFYVDYIL